MQIIRIKSRDLFINLIVIMIQPKGAPRIVSIFYYIFHIYIFFFYIVLARENKIARRYCTVLRTFVTVRDLNHFPVARALGAASIPTERPIFRGLGVSPSRPATAQLARPDATTKTRRDAAADCPAGSRSTFTRHYDRSIIERSAV